MLGDLSRLELNYSEARLLFSESLLISREIDDKWFVTGSLNNLGFVAFDEGDYESAGAHFGEALVKFQEFALNLSQV